MLNWGTSAFVEYTATNYDEIKDFLTKWEIDDTFFVDPLYFFKNFIFLGLFTYFSVTSQKSKRAIAVFSALGIIFTIVNSIWGETYKEYQSVGSSVDNVYKIFAGGVILNWIFNSDLNKRLWKISYYWFAMAIIVIGAIAGLIDFLSNYMFKETSVIFFQVHIVKNFMMIIAFIMFTVGIYFIKKKVKLRSEKSK